MLESDPHRVLEGMALAAYAVGRHRGFIYVRAEYPLAIERLKTAIRQATRQGLAGTEHLRDAFQFRRRDPAGSRRVCVRRRDGLDGLDRRLTRASRGRGRRIRRESGLLGLSHADQQRRDAGQHPPDHPPRRRVVRRRSARRTRKAPRSSLWPAGSATRA